MHLIILQKKTKTPNQLPKSKPVVGVVLHNNACFLPKQTQTEGPAGLPIQKHCNTCKQSFVYLLLWTKCIGKNFHRGTPLTT